MTICLLNIISALYFNRPKKLMLIRKGVPVSLCIARMLHVELVYEKEARLSHGVMLISGEARVGRW